MLGWMSNALAAIQEPLSRADVYVFGVVNGVHGSVLLDKAMLFASLAGVGLVQTGLGLFFVLSGLIADRLSWRRAGYAALVAFAFSGVAVQTAKHIWSRPRPLLQVYEIRVLDGPFFFNSFPSGHSATAFAVMVACSAFLPRARWLLIGAAALCGVSRVYLGAHFPLDVIYGSTIGIAIGTLSARLVR